MGCTSSKKTERYPGIFAVVAMDEDLKLSPGFLEVSSSDLLWHRGHKPSIAWPLNGLRKYGYAANNFCFESGRRCPTGHGFYTFKCKKAEKLFNLLQEKAQRESQINENRRAQDNGNINFCNLKFRKHSYVNLKPTPAQFTYAQLILVEAEESQSPSPRTSKSYVLIDFDKTNALSQSANPRNDEGFRKTRHNSSVSD